MTLDDIVWFGMFYLASVPIVVLFDRSISVEGEWIWQCVARLTREHRRLYPKSKGD